LNQETHRKLISGNSTNLRATPLRALLSVAAGGYLMGVGLRNFLYDKKWLKTYSANVPVISVGNITAGGTGKTPLVIWLCKFLQQKNIQCAILTRGYKAAKNLKLKTQTYKDEMAIFAESCPQAKVIINPDRVAGAAEALGKFGAKVLIMDDGFQHRRLARDLDIVTIDALRPFGYGRMLPAGVLREPVTALKRADAVVITKCDQIDKTQLAEIEKKLQITNPDLVIARSVHQPTCAKSTGDKEISLEQLKDKRIFAFCGIGNPQAFLNTVRRVPANLVGWKIYNDHYHYSDIDIADIYEQAKNSKADLILTTQKDWHKIIPLTPDIQDSNPQIQLACLVIQIEFISAEEKITRLIEYILASKITGT